MTPLRPVAIQVHHLSKTYPVYASPLDALKEVVTGRKRHTDVAALDDVSFRVLRGERVGIVGANGAGKSTLLKILAGTVDHTGGHFRIHGELRAILELGTGFHEECTGRENILMGGMCLGYSQRELQERMDWIIAFSELGRVIDQPLRTYSSGMKMRLMYSVAFCRRVELMIIDEALATGDGAFVRKCTNHIVELCGGGTTALIVSHNLYFLERICHRVLYLRDGRVVADGEPLAVCKQYERDLGQAFVAMADGSAVGASADVDADAVPAPVPAGAAGEDGDATGPIDADDEDLFMRGNAEGCGDRAPPIPAADITIDATLDGTGSDGLHVDGKDKANGVGQVLLPDGTWEELDFSGAPAVIGRRLVTLKDARMYDGQGRAAMEVCTGEPCRFRFLLESTLRKPDVHVGFMIWNDTKEHVATSTNVCSLDGLGRPNPVRLDLEEGIFSVDVVFPSLRLGAGRYYLKFGVSPGFEHYSDDDLLLSEDRCLAFAVTRRDHVQTVHYEPHSVWSPLRRITRAGEGTMSGEVSP